MPSSSLVNGGCVPEVKVNPYRDWLGITGPVRTHYERLGVQPTDSAEVIQKQYEAKYAEAHRYKIGKYETEAQQLLGELSAAYRCLSDAKLRAEYDRQLRQQSTAADHPTVVDVPLGPGSAPSTTDTVEVPTGAAETRRVPKPQAPAAKGGTPLKAPAIVAATATGKPPQRRAANTKATSVAGKPSPGEPITAEVVDEDIVNAEVVAFEIVSHRRKLPIITVAVLSVCVVIAGFFMMRAVTGVVAPPVAAPYPVTGDATLTSIRLDRDPTGATIARMILDGAAAPVNPEDASIDSGRFEAVVTDPVLVQALATITSAQENAGEGDPLMFDGILETAPELVTKTDRIASNLPLISLTSLRPDSSAGGFTGPFPVARELPPERLSLLQKLRSPDTQISLRSEDVQILSEGRDYWHVRIGPRQFAISFTDYEVARRYGEVASGLMQLSVQPSGTSRGLQVSGRWASLAELRGRLEPLPSGATVKWSGTLSSVRIVSTGGPDAGVYLRVVAARNSTQPSFEAFTADPAFAREIADFATASSQGAGEAVLVEGTKIGTNTPAAVAGATGTGAELTKVQIASVWRQRDGLTIRPGEKRSAQSLKLSEDAIAFLQQLRTVGSSVICEAKIESIVSRSPPQFRVRPAGVSSDYVVSVTDWPSWATVGANIRVEASRTDALIPCDIFGQFHDLPELAASSIKPTFRELQNKPAVYLGPSFRYPLTISGRPPAGLSGTLNVSIDDSGKSVSVSLPIRLPSHAGTALRGLKPGDSLIGEFSIASDDNSTGFGGRSLRPALTALYRTGEDQPLAQFVPPGSAPAVPKHKLAVLAPYRSTATMQIYLAGQSGAGSSGQPVVKWSPDGSFLATAATNSELAVWDVSTSSAVRRATAARHASGQPAQRIGWSPRSDVLYITSSTPGQGEPTRDQRLAATTLFEMPSGDNRLSPLTLKSEIGPVFSPDGSWMFVGHDNAIVGYHPPSFLTSAVRASVASGPRNLSGALAAAVAPNGSLLATLERSQASGSSSSSELEIVIRSLTAFDSVVGRLPAEGITPTNTIEFAWCDNQGQSGHRFAVSDGKTATLLTWSQTTSSPPPPAVAELLTSWISHDTNWNVIASWNGGNSGRSGGPAIQLYETKTGQPTALLEGIATNAGVFSVSPKGDRIAVSIDASDIVVGTLGSGFTHQITLQYSSPVVALDWSPDGSRLASCHSNQVVNIWNADPAASEPLGTAYVFDWTERVQSAEAAVDAQDWVTYHSIYPELVNAVKEKQLSPDQMSRVVLIEGKRKKEAARLLAEYNRLKKSGNFRELQTYLAIGQEYLECDPKSRQAAQIRRELSAFGNFGF
jgi:WD40 repeat protein